MSPLSLPDSGITSNSTATRPASLRSSTNTSSQNLVLREIIRPWASVSPVPPSCRAVSESRWTRFSVTPLEEAGPTSSPTDSETDLKKKTVAQDHLKASVLCAASGTTPDFDDARALEGEGVPVAIAIPIPVFASELDKLQRRQQQLGKPRNVRKKFMTNLDSSWSTASSDGSSIAEDQSPASSQMEDSDSSLTFGREGIKRVSTCSLLTASLKKPGVWRSKAGKKSEDSFEKPHVTLSMAKEYGIGVLSASHLENAFEDSDED